MSLERFTIIKEEYDSNSELQQIAMDEVPCMTFTAETSSMSQLNNVPDPDRIAQVDSTNSVVLPPEARK